MQATAVVRQEEITTEQTEEIPNENNNNNDDVQDRQEAPTSTSSTAPKERQRKISKKQQYQNDLTDKILQLAQKEEDQIDLELGAIAARMKRKLNEQEIDELLDEINNVTRAFFLRKRRRTEIASVSLAEGPSTSAADGVVSLPPPLLQRQPQVQQVQHVQHVHQPPPLQRQGQMEEELVESGDVLFGSEYNMQYVTDPTNNNTYMALQ